MKGPVPEFAGVYLIKNTKNGRVYVGASRWPDLRYQDHVTLLKRGKHHNKNLQADYEIYGLDAFTFEVAERTRSTESRDELNKQEIEWMFRLKDQGVWLYNAKLSG